MSAAAAGLQIVRPRKITDPHRGTARMLYGSFPDSIYKPRVLVASELYRCDSLLEDKPRGHVELMTGGVEYVRLVLKGRRAIPVRLCVACARAYGVVR